MCGSVAGMLPSLPFLSSCRKQCARLHPDCSKSEHHAQLCVVPTSFVEVTCFRCLKMPRSDWDQEGTPRAAQLQARTSLDTFLVSLVISNNKTKCLYPDAELECSVVLGLEIA